MLQNKFWQGFFAIAPIVLFVFFFIGYFIFIFSFVTQISELEEHARNGPPTALFAGIGVYLLFFLFIMLTSLGSLIFYILHAIQNPNLKQGNTLVVWILLFVFVSGLGQLIYWIIEILGKRNAQEEKIL